MLLDKSADSRALVEAIVRLGETFGLDLVAEGIETPAQRAALVALGCHQGQGFLYAPGLPADQALAYIAVQSLNEVDDAYAALTQNPGRKIIR